MTVASEIAACPECRELINDWWQRGIADDRIDLRQNELAFYEHPVKHHPTVGLYGREGCRDCQQAVTIAQFVLPDTAIYLQDGTYVDPARLHFVHHFVEKTADLDRAAPATLTSGHTITAYLYHASGDAPAGHVCSPDRGHDYHVTVELTAPAHLVTDDQTVALKTVVAELERDLQHRELERVGDGGLATLDDLARWVHTTVAHRLAAGLRDHLVVRAEAPDAYAQATVFPPPQ
ncbi:hypothetical protein ACFY9A_37915 [Streptomyces rubradiris]|uniref:hypothetical protein n=1 Tax=Streptomyces rubradiris TaxID=285531 RepID=UPI0036EC9344